MTDPIKYKCIYSSSVLRYCRMLNNFFLEQLMKLISSWISLNIYCILIVRECNKYKPIYKTYSVDSIYTQYIPTTRSPALFSLTHFPRIQFENTQLNRLIFNNFSALSSALSTVIARSWERSINFIWLSISVLAILLLDSPRASCGGSAAHLRPL